MEDFATVVCPFCAQSFPVELDVTGGVDQVFVLDCEVCCRPVQLHLRFDEAGECSCEASSDV